MAHNLKSASVDASFGSGAFLFGADSQAATAPSIYSGTTVFDYLKTLVGAWTNTQSISVSSATVALRITQTGAGDILRLEDSSNPDSTPVVFDASGKQIIGHTASLVVGAASGNERLQIHAADATGSQVLSRWSADAASQNVSMFKSRAATIGTFTVVQSGDALGSINFLGADGTAAILAAGIRGEVDGTPGTNDMPGRLLFLTTADGAAGLTERARLTNAGDWGIGCTPDRRLHAESDDASNTSVTYLARLTHTTSGSPGNGIGVGLEFEVETSAANNEIGATIEAVTTDTTAASEDFDLVFKAMAGGSAAAEVFRVKSTGVLRVTAGATVANASTATAMSSLGPAGANTTIQGWVALDVAGTTRFIPYW